jgi:hypothetical protein
MLALLLDIATQNTQQEATSDSPSVFTYLAAGVRLTGTRPALATQSWEATRFCSLLMIMLYVCV